MNDTTDWTPERIELIKRSICPRGITDDEFLLFIEQCKRSGLDPLLKQAFCVPRSVKISAKGQPERWATKHEFQPSEAGMLTRAESFPDYGGIESAEVYAEDPIVIDYGAGTVDHKVNPAQRKGMLVGAWARVVRNGKRPVVVWVDFAAANQPTPLWGKMPAVMVRKCSRVAALRTAYPAAFGGLYVAGERPDDVETGEDVEAPVVVTREKPALPSPAPREVLVTSVAREAVTLSRAGDFDKAADVLNRALTSDRDPGTDDVDPIEAECASICEKAATLKAPEDMDALHALKPRALALPEKSPERKQAGAALNEAWTRIKKAGGA